MLHNGTEKYRYKENDNGSELAIEEVNMNIKLTVIEHCALYPLPFIETCHNKTVKLLNGAVLENY